MLDIIKKRLEMAGFFADILEYCSGNYYDGSGDHGYYYKMLYISPETWTEREYAMRAAKNAMRGAIKRDYIIETIPASKAFHIVTKADRAAADQASEEGRIFSEFYWTYLHDYAPHTPDGRLIIDPFNLHNRRALEAGKRAVKAWKEGRAA